MIVVHLGGNDLTTVKQGKLMGMINKDLFYMASTFPAVAFNRRPSLNLQGKFSPALK